jgi:hypothetical protein
MRDSKREDFLAMDLQIEANRRNAQLSTGPKTEQGKEASRMNALKRGLTAQQVALFDERLEDFQAFHAELIGALAPQGTVELALAERGVVCAWRLRRVYRIETGFSRKAHKACGNGTATTTNEIAVVFLRLASQEMISPNSPAMRSASSARSNGR